MGREKNRNYRLTRELLMSYCNAALLNAARLAEEAALLDSHGHAARAYFLAVASIEETGKGIQAFEGQGRRISHPEVALRLKLSFEDHRQKIMSAFLPWLMSAKDLRATTETAMSLVADISLGREPAMYIDISPDGPRILDPANVIRAKAAQDCVRLAKDCLDYARVHVLTRCPSEATRPQDEVFAMKPDRFSAILRDEKFWDFYASRVEAGDNKFAEAVVVHAKKIHKKPQEQRMSIEADHT